MNPFQVNNSYLIHVKPKSSKSEIIISEDKGILVYVHSPPEDGKATAEVVTVFKKQLGIKIEVISGHTSKTKKIKVLSIRA